MKKRITIAASAVCLLGLAALAAVLLILNGVYLPNAAKASEYEVVGVDVSHYQGDIDWEILSGEDIDFAFIKATEGSSYVDPLYEYNARKAAKTGLEIGAYHFFSFDSPGETQAENFISTVGDGDGMLPPTVDLEPYGRYKRGLPAKVSVKPELDALLDALEEHYGKKPIIYTTERAYKKYLANGYEEYDIWIRSVFRSPKLSDSREWTFWQYSDKGRLHGYSGEERFIDLNVFRGTLEEFYRYGR